MKKILLIDDHEVVRDGIRSIFDALLTKASFGEAGSPNEALRLVREHAWDVAVLDISLGNRSGLDLLADLKRLRPEMPVLVLSMHSEEQYARRAFQAGASGYITKDARRSELLKAIKKVADGGKYLSPALAEKLIVDLEKGSNRMPHENLSGREFEILRLIGSGKTVTEIAETLSLSKNTISTYRARILEKMEMRTNAELTYYAVRNNLVD